MGPAQPARSSASATPSSSTSATSSKSTHTTKVTTPTTIEKLPMNIPCLEPNRSNWAIFSMCFQKAMTVTCQWGYFSGLKPHPKIKDENVPTDEEIKATETWKYEDSVASYLLSQ